MSDVREHTPAWFADMVMPAGRDDAASICPGRETEPLLIDPRPCELCGLTIDRHEIERRVLVGLKTKLLAPELVHEFGALQDSREAAIGVVILAETITLHPQRLE